MNGYAVNNKIMLEKRIAILQTFYKPQRFSLLTDYITFALKDGPSCMLSWGETRGCKLAEQIQKV